jgi:hypothetical protein
MLLMMTLSPVATKQCFKPSASASSSSSPPATVTALPSSLSTRPSTPIRRDHPQSSLSLKMSDPFQLSFETGRKEADPSPRPIGNGRGEVVKVMRAGCKGSGGRGKDPVRG